MRRHVVTPLAMLFAAAAAAAPPADPWHVKARDMLGHAIGVPTVAGRGRTPELARWFADQFRAAGFAPADIHLMPYAPEPGNDTAALIVRWRSVHPTKRPMLLMGHMDVVEALPADWSIDPFALVEKDGYYYGRGVMDMKTPDVAMAVAMMRLKAQGFQPGRDVILLLTGDEETAGQGALLAATRWRALVDAEFALNGDAGGGRFDASGKPLGYTLQTAEKTYADYLFTVTNKGGHSSQPRPDNAIYQLAHALTRLAAWRFAPALNATTRGYLAARQKSEQGPLGDAMRAWLRDPDDGRAADAIEADPNEIGITRTRCVATRLAGGDANNALPQLATATVNCRILPGEQPDAVRDLLQRIAGDPGVKVTRLDADPMSIASPPRADVTAAYTAAVHRRHPDSPIVPEMSAGASDGAALRAAGIPVYGVDGEWWIAPEDERAHGRDERIPVRAFDEDVDHWTDMVAMLAR